MGKPDAPEAAAVRAAVGANVQVTAQTAATEIAGQQGMSLHTPVEQQPQPPGHCAEEPTSKAESCGAQHEALEDVVPTQLCQQDRERLFQLLRTNSTGPIYRSQGNTSILARIAENKVFENLTLLIITMNALWLGVDVELNDAESWVEAHLVFKVADNFFCSYFTLEVLIRACAYGRLVQCFFDKELFFDSVLVLLMILETWVLPLISAMMAEGGVNAQMSQASVFRLLRLLRLTRMIRLMRAFPELVVLIKGMMSALRSVATNIMFLLAGLWVFSIIFLQTYEDVKDTDADYLIDLRCKYFGSLGTSMVTLFVNGTLLDDLADLALTLKEDNLFLLMVFFCFVLISSLTLLNMLIGVLAEVVSRTAAKETDDQSALDMIRTMQDVFNVADLNDDEYISVDEFVALMETRDSPTASALKGIGIDPIHLDSLYRQLFEDEDLDLETLERVCPCGNPLMPDAKFCRKCGLPTPNREETHSKKTFVPAFATKQLGFVEFMDALLKLKPSIVSVRDVVSLRRTSVCASQEVMGGLMGVKDRLQDLAAAVRDLQDRLSAAFTAPADRAVDLLAAWPVEGMAAQHADTQVGNSARGTCSQTPSATEGIPTEPAAPGRAADLPSFTIQSSGGVTEDVSGARWEKSPQPSSSPTRQMQDIPASSTSQTSTRWPPAPVEPLDQLPSLGGLGSTSSASFTSMALGSPRGNSGQTCTGKLSTVPTEMIIEEMARRMLKGIDLY